VCDFPIDNFEPHTLLDITPIVKAWHDMEIPNHGLLVMVPAWENKIERTYMHYYQREFDETSTKATRLIIVCGNK
jgi:hypothetical protein